jgi:hypothetical protein
MRNYIEAAGDPLEKYRNIQFLLHLEQVTGREGVELFLKDFYLDEPDLFLRDRLRTAEKIEKERLKAFEQNLQQGA